MIDKKYVGEEVVNKRGEHGFITKIDELIYVNFGDHESMYCEDAFANGFLEFLNPCSNEKLKLEKSACDLKDFEEKLKEPLKELNSLVGLENIKVIIDELVCQTKISKIRQVMGLKVPDTTNHMVFTGNPGTGKTTVARIVGKIFNALGVLSSGHVVEVDRSHLIAAYQGQTALKTLKVLKSALGGVLFIDEAYAVCRGDNDDYGYEALDTITKFMEDHRDDIVIIAAGYGREMMDFINSNPGLSSRFKTFISFDDYSGDELFNIFNDLFVANDYSLSDEAKASAIDFFRNENICHSNARDARNIFEKTLIKQSKRLSSKSKLTQEDLMEIRKEDLCMQI